MKDNSGNVGHLGDQIVCEGCYPVVHSQATGASGAPALQDSEEVNTIQMLLYRKASELHLGKECKCLVGRFW